MLPRANDPGTKDPPDAPLGARALLDSATNNFVNQSDAAWDKRMRDLSAMMDDKIKIFEKKNDAKFEKLQADIAELQKALSCAGSTAGDGGASSSRFDGPSVKEHHSPIQSGLRWADPVQSGLERRTDR